MCPAHQPDRTRARIRRQALSVGLAVAPFGIVFGVACAEAGLSWLDALGFSALTFAGSSQFAAVGVLGTGGTAAAAIGAGLLLNVRSLAFGVVLTPDLDGPWWQRALLAQLVIDESTAVATIQEERRWRRYGFVAAGLSVFVLWNVTTLLGVALGSVGDDFVTEWGFDAAAPAAFLALLWPRLTDRGGATGRRIALVGAAIAAAAVPLTHAGIPILLAGLAVLAVRGPSEAPSGPASGAPS